MNSALTQVYGAAAATALWWLIIRPILNRWDRRNARAHVANVGPIG